MHRFHLVKQLWGDVASVGQRSHRQFCGSADCDTRGAAIATEHATSTRLQVSARLLLSSASTHGLVTTFLGSCQTHLSSGSQGAHEHLPPLEREEGAQLGSRVGVYTHGSHVAIRLYGKHYLEVRDPPRVMGDTRELDARFLKDPQVRGWREEWQEE